MVRFTFLLRLVRSSQQQNEGEAHPAPAKCSHRTDAEIQS